MGRAAIAVSAAALFTPVSAPGRAAAPPAPLVLDHVWIAVAPGAPERAALEKAGFRIAPDVNRHDGRGTASVTAEFRGRYLELIYVDSSVPVSPGLEIVAKKFQRKAAWRETRASPFGIGARRTASTPAAFPFSTWKVAEEWMPRGSSMEILTPREMPDAPSLFVTAEPVDEAKARSLAADPVRGAMFRHPNGAREMTSVRMVVPNNGALPPAAKYLSEAGVATFDAGPDWLLEIDLDEGKQGITRDLRPALPVVFRY